MMKSVTEKIMKKRSEGYFGLHFDFHATADCTEVGKTVTEEMIREVVEAVRPDFIQCDCKGAEGYSSYPTKVGNPAPGFVKDQLRIWRKVTKEVGIPLIMHYTGLKNARTVALHPEWAIVHADGSRDTTLVSPFTGHVDAVLIPQFLELASEYGVDGVWVNGEVVWVTPDFNDQVVAAFETESGARLPRNAEGKYDTASEACKAFLEFCRRRYFDYQAHYLDTVRAKVPHFEMATNWAHSSMMPKPVRSSVDFLSGDYGWNDDYHFARFEGRCFCEQGKPWDLMGWGFFHDFSPTSACAVKSPEALCRGAAGVLALGGGFQVYLLQNRDGSVRLWEVQQLKGLARFVREREPFLKGGTPFSSIGVLHSDYDLGKRVDSHLFYNFGAQGAPAQGAVRLVLDSAHACGMVMDFMLTPERLKGKRVLILPELKYIGDTIKAALLTFVEHGGSLVLSGRECCTAFGDVLDVAIPEESRDKVIFINDPPRVVTQYAKGYVSVSAGANAEVLKTCIAEGGETPADAPSYPIVTKTAHGKGSIVAIHYNLFETYFNAPDFYARNMVSDILDDLDTEKRITYCGQRFVDIVPMEKDGALLISLINTGGIYTENRLRAYDEVQTLADIEVSVKVGREPASVTLQPGNVVPKYAYDPATQRVTVAIDRLHIHAIVVISRP